MSPLPALKSLRSVRPLLVVKSRETQQHLRILRGRDSTLPTDRIPVGTGSVNPATGGRIVLDIVEGVDDRAAELMYVLELDREGDIGLRFSLDSTWPPAVSCAQLGKVTAFQATVTKSSVSSSHSSKVLFRRRGSWGVARRRDSRTCSRAFWRASVLLSARQATYRSTAESTAAHTNTSPASEDSWPELSAAIQRRVPVRAAQAATPHLLPNKGVGGLATGAREGEVIFWDGRERAAVNLLQAVGNRDFRICGHDCEHVSEMKSVGSHVCVHNLVDVANYQPCH